MTTALVACGRKKQGHPAPACDLYTSDLFQKSRAYAERVGDAWFVLSAKHGLLEPTRVVEPYDLSLYDLNRGERGAWADRVLQTLALSTPPLSSFVVLAGSRYRSDLVPALELAGHHVTVPLAGLGIGRQLAWLKGQL